MGDGFLSLIIHISFDNMSGMNTKPSAKKVNISVNNIVEKFRKTGKYSVAFLRDLKDGLSDLQKSKAWKSK